MENLGTITHKAAVAVGLIDPNITDRAADDLSKQEKDDKKATASATQSESTVRAAVAIDKNRGVVFRGPKMVAVEDIGAPKFYLDEQKRPCEHGVIVKVVASCICGSDLHMYRARALVKPGTCFGHEITGEVIQLGRDVEFVKVGDLVSVPFNVACGRCQNCFEQKTGACQKVNPTRDGGAYGFAQMGGWVGGQAEYAMIPYADFNCLVIPGPRERAMERILSLACLTDIFPTGFDGAFRAGVGTGSTVYVAGAGPVGLACAVSCQLLGAAVVIVGDQNPSRLALAASFGCKTVNLSEKGVSLEDHIQRLTGKKEVDQCVDCVGFEAHGCGSSSEKEEPEAVLNDVMKICRSGGGIGVPGLYVEQDPLAAHAEAKVGVLNLRFGVGWMKGLSLTTGQCSVKRYNYKLMELILNDKVDVGKCVNATVIGLEDAPQAYADFENGVAKKYIIDPHGIIRNFQAKKAARVAKGK